MSIAVVGMLDEREEALRIIKDRIEQRGHKALLIDITVGTGAIIPTVKADVTCEELLALAEKAGGLISPAAMKALPFGIPKLLVSGAVADALSQAMSAEGGAAK